MLWDIVSWPVRLFGGLLAACLAAVFLLRLPVLSASGSSGLSESGGSGSGAEEDAPGPSNDNPNYIIQVGNVFGFIISIENVL